MRGVHGPSTWTSYTVGGFVMTFKASYFASAHFEKWDSCSANVCSDLSHMAAAKFTSLLCLHSAKARQKAGWINRSFYCRQGWFMRHKWNTLVAPHPDYCNLLWAPSEGSELEKLEKVFKNLTAKVPAVIFINS